MTSNSIHRPNPNPNVEPLANILARSSYEAATAPDYWLALARRVDADGLLAHPVERTVNVRRDLAAVVEQVLLTDNGARADGLSDAARLDDVRTALRELLGVLGPIGDPRELHQRGELARHAIHAAAVRAAADEAAAGGAR